ncbi:MAG TPA: DUF4388 domain-containing protein [Acidobacteriota bacterium]|nr:DUF4388 domain-containing protein [Acidobacteriota bacterium]
MKGSLGQQNVADIVAVLHFSGLSGTLRLTQADVTKKIYFKGGLIIFAHSSQVLERLGQILIRLGKIDADDLSVVAKEVESGKRLGQALKDRGFVSDAEVLAAVSYQIQQVLFSVLNWSDGEYEFIERAQPVFDDITVTVSTPDLLMDGIRNISNTKVLSRAIGSEDQRVIYKQPKARRIQRKNWDFAEETVLALLSHGNTVGELRSASRLTPQEFGRALYALLMSGTISLASLDMAQDAGSVVASVPRESIGKLRTMEEPEIRKMVAAVTERFQGASDQAILELQPGFTRHDLNAAYLRLNSIYQPLFNSETRYLDIKDQLGKILDRLAAARDAMMSQAAAPPSDLPSASTGLATVEPAEAAPFNSAALNQTPYVSYILKSDHPLPESNATLDVLSNGDDVPGAAEIRSAEISSDSTMLRRLAKKMRDAGKAKEAEKYYLQAMEINKMDLENHFALADFYESQGLKFKAFEQLNAILQLDPENARAMNLLGLQKRRKAMYDIAGVDKNKANGN